MIRVVCWLWNDPEFKHRTLFSYGPEHVNRLRAMVRRNLDMDHEFVCVTDRPEGIDPDIRIIPLWDDLREMGGCYARLKAFSPEMAEVIGPRFVWIDLDCVITGDITSLLDRDEDFVIWQHEAKAAPYCGAFVMMTAGARKEVWDNFDPKTSPKKAADRGFIGTDQAWISACLRDEAVWTREHGVYRFGSLKHGEDISRARILFFNGARDPSVEKTRQEHPWIDRHWRC